MARHPRGHEERVVTGPPVDLLTRNESVSPSVEAAPAVPPTAPVQMAGFMGPIIKRLTRGADEITSQRAGPGQTQSLVGDIDAPLIGRIEQVAGETQPGRFVDDTGKPLPAAAININLSRLNTTEDIDRALVATGELFAGEIGGARRGFITNKMTEALASDMGLTVEQLLKRRKGEAFNAETATAARRLLASSAAQLIDLAKKAADDGGDRSLMAFRRAMVIHSAIQAQVSGLTAEAGRALQAFNIVAGSDREMIRNIQEMIQAGGGADVSRRMAKRLSDAAASGQLTRGMLNKVVRKGALSRTGNAFLEVWINALLSGPQTQAVNLLSNALVATWAIPVRLVASAIPGSGIRPGEAKAMLYGMFRGYADGLVLAGRVLRTGESTDVLGKIDLPQRKAISAEAFGMSGMPGQAIDLLGEFVRLSGRGLLAGDELFKAVGYRMELHARSSRVASSEGLEGKAMAVRMDEIMRNPPEDIRLAGIDASRYQTFTKELGAGGKKFQELVNAVPVLRLVTPFIRTPINIMKFVGEGTALAPLSSAVRAELAAGGPRRAVALAKISMGSMASGFAVLMASHGLLTGNGPSEPASRAVWLTTHQPNSIKIGDEWVAYGRLEPLGAFFGIAADLQMIMGSLDDEERQNFAVALTIAISKNVTSKTFLRGLSEAARVLDNPDRYGERFIQAFISTAVPSMVAQIARVQDPVLRDVRSMFDKVCSRIPGCSKTLPPRRNIWGEVIVLGGGIGPDIMSPLYTNDIKDNPVSDEILRLGLGVRMPSRQIDGVELTGDEYDEFSRLAGEQAFDQLTRLIANPSYKRLTDGPGGSKAVAIKQVLSLTRQVARAQIQTDPRFTDLTDRIGATAIGKARKLSPLGSGSRLP